MAIRGDSDHTVPLEQPDLGLHYLLRCIYLYTNLEPRLTQWNKPSSIDIAVLSSSPLAAKSYQL